MIFESDYICALVRTCCLSKRSFGDVSKTRERENGEWRMENGEWRMESEEWRVGNWEIEIGKIENGKKIKNSQLDFKD